MSEDAKSLMYWSGSWRDTQIADYYNTYEFWCARNWAASIIGASC